MAGFVPSPNTIRVLWHVTTHGRPQLYVTHGLYSIAGPLNPNIATQIYASFTAAVAGQALLNAFAPTFSFTGVGVIDLRSANNPEIPSTGTAIPGTGVGLPLPDSSAVCVTLRTAMAGRSFRGRTYVFGWVSDAVAADGTISDTAAADAAALVTNFRNAMTPQSVSLAIRSPALPERPAHGGGTLPAKDYFITPVETILVRDRIWDTNRRRLDVFRR